MKVGIGLSPGVLLGHARAELEMGTHRLLEWLVVRQARLVERLHVEGHEPVPLLIRDLQVAVHIDQVLKTKLAREAVRATERFRGEPDEARSDGFFTSRLQPEFRDGRPTAERPSTVMSRSS